MKAQKLGTEHVGLYTVQGFWLCRCRGACIFGLIGSSASQWPKQEHKQRDGCLEQEGQPLQPWF